MKNKLTTLPPRIIGLFATTNIYMYYAFKVFCRIMLRILDCEADMCMPKFRFSRIILSQKIKIDF